MKEHTNWQIQCIMTFIGGFMGGYSIINHSDLFSCAQTTNMASIALSAAGKPDPDWIFRIICLLIYISGLSLTVLISRKKRLNLKIFSIILDVLVLFLMGFIPETINPFIASAPLFFAASVQWCAFSGANGFTSSSIFSTNNLRQFVTSMTEYCCSNDEHALQKGKYFGSMLFSFYLGVVISFFGSQSMGIISSWLAFFPLSISLILVLKNETEKSEIERKKIRIPA